MIRRIYVFLGLFAFVCYLEAIGSTYTISAVQSIERQFHIPSKLSGFLISAHDLSYIPTVIFISYFGARGNRAKWIGAGTIIIAVAQLLVATPNFLFPVKMPTVNLTQIEDRLRPDPLLLSSDVSLPQLFTYPPLRDRIPIRLRNRILTKIGVLDSADLEEENLNLTAAIYSTNQTESLYSLDETLISETFLHAKALFNNEEDSQPLIESLQKFIQNRVTELSNGTEADIKKLRKAATAPFAFCNRLINDLRSALKELQCHTDSSNVGPLVVIFMSMILLGFGRTMPWALGVPLIDDNVKSKSTPLYLAVISFIKILGPICGFLIGSAVNKLYFTFPARPPPGLTPTDPQWIGAWWLGFLLIGLAMIVPSIALFCFPESSSASKKREKIALENGSRIEPKSEKVKLSLFDRHVKHDKEKSGEEKFREFLGSYRSVLSTPVYTSSVVGRVMDVLAFKGYLVFLPKYLENHYGIPQYRVHSLMAMFGVFGFACGAMVGGFVMRRWKLNGRGAALFIVIMSLINTSLFASKSLLGCHSTVNRIGLSGASTNFNYTRSCNSECGCESARLFPVCDVSGHPFYSPCHAGCRHVSVVDINTYRLEFSECECAVGGMVKKEFCRDDCGQMTIIFFFTVITGAFAAGCAMVPGMLILLRAVPPATRSISLGLQGFMVSLFGTLPSPILWGAIVDSACLIWDKVCNHRGACIIYDPATLRIRMHITYACMRLVSTIIDCYVLYNAKDLNLVDESETEEKEAEDDVVKQSIPLETVQ